MVGYKLKGSGADRTMFRRTLVAFVCRAGVCQPAHIAPARHAVGLRLLPASTAAAIHNTARTRLWQRPISNVLAHTSSQALQQYPLPSSVATFSSLTSTSELSAAITAAPSQSALQTLAAAAASTPQQAWLAHEYKVQLLSALEEQEAAVLTKILLFYSKLGPGHEELFQQAVPVLYNSLGLLSLQDQLRLLLAFSGAAQHSPAVYSQELYAALSEFLWEGLGQLGPRGLADVAWGYAAVQHYNDDEDFFGGLVAAALEKLETFCPEDLSRLIQALGRLRFSAPLLNKAALQQMSSQLDAWPLSCIGRLLWGLAAVQDSADPCVLDRVGGHVSVVLRNLRTSTDGQRVLSGLGARTAAAGAAAAGAGAAGDGSDGGGGGGAGAAALKGDGNGFAGLGAAGQQQGSGGPTWQGFGMTRSSSSMSSSSMSMSSSDGGGSGGGSGSGGVGGGGGAADVFAAAAASSSLYEYEESNPLGPEFLTVTTYAPDGKVTTTYIKRDAASTQLGSSSSVPSTSGGGSSSSNGNGVPAEARGSSASNSTGTSSGGGSGGRSSGVRSGVGGGVGGVGVWRTRVQRSYDECPPDWQVSSLHSDCRPVYDDAEALQGALVDLVWSFAMLGHSHASMAKECFKALALVLPDAFCDAQLTMLWAAHMRYQQLGHVMLDPNPLLAESCTVFVKELSRAAPRTISLPSHLQALAAADYLLSSIRHSPEYEQQQQQQQQAAHFSSWKFRDPAVLTQRGLEASVRQALQALGLPVGEPLVTLDGLERVGLPLKHHGVHIAWQVLPPQLCCRNPPYTPSVEAAMHRWALQYRGYTVLQVPFHEWASVLESGDLMIQAGYLQQMLNGLSVRIAKMDAANL